MTEKYKQEKIVLPEELQIEMMKFFLKTSIPRRIKLEREKQISLSEKKIGEKNAKEIEN